MTSVLTVLGTLIVPVPALCANIVKPVEQANPPPVIFGRDDRQDLYQVADPAVRALADSTVALLRTNQIKPLWNGIELLSLVYGQRYKLCPEERFYKQPIVAFCSGALVGPDVVLTAGHCMPSQNMCDETAFVFGYAIRRQGERPDLVSPDAVYRCGKLLGMRDDTHGDWALIRLDRPVKNHRPLAVRRSGQIASKEPLIVIGHFSGLPTKVVTGGSVSKRGNGYFKTGLLQS